MFSSVFKRVLLFHDCKQAANGLAAHCEADNHNLDRQKDVVQFLRQAEKNKNE